MEPIQFIHAADLHLGSPLKGIGSTSEYLRTKLQHAGFQALHKIVDAAISSEVDFVVLAGDTYDAESRSVQANQKFAQELKRLDEHDIPVYMIAGNHDPLTKNTRELFTLPDNTHILSSQEVETFEVHNDGHLIARVLGQSYRGKSDSRKMYSQFTPPDTAVWNIGVLHTAMDENTPNYVPCTLSDLQSKADIHYWALGHVHKGKLIQKQDPVIAYPGTPQGHDIAESGMKGCLLTKLTPNQEPEVRFIPTGSVVWSQREISIDEQPFDTVETMDELIELMISAADDQVQWRDYLQNDIPIRGDIDEDDILEGIIYRWIISGSGELHHILNENPIETQEQIAEILRHRLEQQEPFIWTESIQMQTRPAIPSLEELANDSELFRDIQEILDGLTHNQELRETLLEQIGQIWDAGSDSEALPEEKLLLDEETLEQLVDEAAKKLTISIVEAREST